LEVRFRGFNLVSAALLSPRSPEQKIEDLNAMLGGYPSLTRRVFGKLVGEPVWWQALGQAQSNWVQPMRCLAQNAEASDFQVLFAYARSKGYQPDTAMVEAIEQDLAQKASLLPDGQQARIYLA
jgi:hypothetical protein